MACQNGSCGRCRCESPDTTQATEEPQLSDALKTFITKIDAVLVQLNPTGVRIQNGDATAQFSDDDFDSLQGIRVDYSNFAADPDTDPRERASIQHVVGQIVMLFIETALKAGQRDKLQEKLGINIIDEADEDFQERIEEAIDGFTPAED